MKLIDIEQFVLSGQLYARLGQEFTAIDSFESMTQMACHWGITVKLLEMRLYRWYTLEQALTMPRYERRRLQRKEK